MLFTPLLNTAGVTTSPLLPTRLVDGNVEIYCNDQWGDDDWDLVDATVVCRQLGYSGAIGATTNSFYGRGV